MIEAEFEVNEVNEIEDMAGGVVSAGGGSSEHACDEHPNCPHVLLFTWPRVSTPS